MAGVIDHRDIGVARAVGKVAQRAPHLERGHIVAGIDHIEAGLLQRRRDQGAVIGRIGKLRHVLIGGIGQHQRHALLGMRRLAEQQQRRGKQKSRQF